VTRSAAGSLITRTPLGRTISVGRQDAAVTDLKFGHYTHRLLSCVRASRMASGAAHLRPSQNVAEGPSHCTLSYHLPHLWRWCVFGVLQCMVEQSRRPQKPIPARWACNGSFDHLRTRLELCEDARRFVGGW
jgi:hypothetical protein